MWNNYVIMSFNWNTYLSLNYWVFQRKHETTTYFISYMAPLHNTQDHMIFEQRVVQYSSKLRLLLAGDHCKPFRSNRSKESTSKIKGVKSLMLSVLPQIHFSKSVNLEIYSSERYEVYIPPTSTSFKNSLFNNLWKNISSRINHITWDVTHCIQTHTRSQLSFS